LVPFSFILVALLELLVIPSLLKLLLNLFLKRRWKSGGRFAFGSLAPFGKDGLFATL
jgi:hypothetical protein